MADTGSFSPQQPEGYAIHPHQQSDNTFLVVDQQPCHREAFPYRLEVKWIFAFGIAKCIIGSLLFLAGIANIVVVSYDIKIAVGIWCGLTVLVNGIVGCVLRFRQSKCLIGAFFGLSITSLVLSIPMLSFYAIVLAYFANVQLRNCYSVYHSNSIICYGVPSHTKSQGIGILSFLTSLVILELASSIGSVVVSCKAYSKCCSTCDVNDCCTCLGCCECDTTQLNVHQESHRILPSSYNPSFHVPPRNQNHPHANTSFQNAPIYSTQPSHFQRIQNQPHVNTNFQSQATYSVQPAQNNPCSGIVSFIVNMPSYMFGGGNGTPFSSVNLNFQPDSSSQQVPGNQPARSAEQVQTIIVGDTQESAPIHT